MEPKTTTEKLPGLNNLTLKTTKKADLKSRSGLIGGSTTILALKNTSSYLIGSCGRLVDRVEGDFPMINCLTETVQRGLKLVENGTKIYSGRLPVQKAKLLDAVYILDFKAYFLCYDSKIYRKDIDRRPAYLWMDITIGNAVGNSLVYSKMNKRLVVAYMGKSLSIVNLRAKRTEFTARHGVSELKRFRVVGSRQDRVVSITQNEVNLDRVDFGNKKVLLADRFRIGAFRPDAECNELAVDPQHRFALVEIAIFGFGAMSQKERGRKVNGAFLLFSITKKDRLELLTYLDVFKTDLKLKLASLECMGYFGLARDDLVFLGLEDAEEGKVWQGGARGKARVVVFNVFSKKLRDVAAGRLKHGEFGPRSVQRVKGEVFYTGELGTVRSLSLV